MVRQGADVSDVNQGTEDAPKKSIPRVVAAAIVATAAVTAVVIYLTVLIIAAQVLDDKET